MPVSRDIEEAEVIMYVFKHNGNCDAKLWFGEVALKGFEETIFNDYIMMPPLFEAYDDFVSHTWPEFVEDNSYM